LTVSEIPTRETDNSRGKADRLREWRREKVWEYKSMGCSVDEILDLLKSKPEIRISHDTVINDLKAKEKEIEKNFANYIEKDLPMQHSLAVTGLDRVIKEGWRMYAKTEEPKVLAIIADAYMKKQAVLGDPAQIERAIKLVGQMKQKLEDEWPSEPDGKQQSPAEEIPQ